MMTARISIKQAARMGIATHKASKLNAVKFTQSKTPFEAACVAAGLQEPVAEFAFCPSRQWRTDWFWPEANGGKGVALEVEGGTWNRGRHSRGKGMQDDMEKYNEMSLVGIMLLRVTPQQMASGEVFALLKRAMP